MAKVGPFIIDPKVGAYCRITLDSREKILVNHDKGGFKGGLLTMSRSCWAGAPTRSLRVTWTVQRARQPSPN